MFPDLRHPKPHILFLPSFYMEPGKPVLGIFFQEQAQAIRRAGVKVAVAYVEPRSLKSFTFGAIKGSHCQITSCEEEGVPTIRLHGWNPLLNTLTGGWVWILATQYLVSRYIKKYGRPDIIHAHNAQWAGFAAYHLWKDTGIPYVITEHHSNFLTGRANIASTAAIRKVYRYASEVIVVSGALGQALQTFTDGRRPCVIPNCVDTDYFCLPPTFSESPRYVFLAVAHLSANKGFDILLRSFAASFKNDMSVFLKIGGDGGVKESLVLLCEELGIGTQVQFLGALTKEGVRSAMWGANAFILSSFHETFGVVLIEAMSTGLPVIATRSGGPDNIVTPEAGILVEPGNVAQLSGAMSQLREGKYFSRNAIRERVASQYGAAVFAEELKSIYEEVVAKSS